MIAIHCDGCGATVYRTQRRRPNKSGRAFCSVACKNKNYGSRAPLADRFWSKVAHAGADECWPWTASVMSNGYGCLRVARVTRTSHTLAWELTRGPIPAGMFVCHYCDNRPCVNPSHLFIGTPRDNVIDMHQKGRNRQPGLHGERHPQAKLNVQIVTEIRLAAAAGKSQTAIAREFGIVTIAQVHNIVHRKQWASEA